MKMNGDERRCPVVSLQSRFATSRFAANRMRFAAHVKSFRSSEVVSLQSRFATKLNSSFPKGLDRWNHLYYPVFPKVNYVSFRMQHVISSVKIWSILLNKLSQADSIDGIVLPSFLAAK